MDEGHLNMSADTAIAMAKLFLKVHFEGVSRGISHYSEDFDLVLRNEVV